MEVWTSSKQWSLFNVFFVNFMLNKGWSSVMKKSIGLPTNSDDGPSFFAPIVRSANHQ